METQGRCYVRFHAATGECAVQDDMSRTVLIVNGTEYGPSAFDMPALAVGDAVKLRVPTGTLSFTVEWADGDYVSGPFHWRGAFNALRGGQSGVAIWHIADMADVVTSAWPEPVPYYVYNRAHNVADTVHISKLRRPLLEQCIRFVLEIDTLLAAKETNMTQQAVIKCRDGLFGTKDVIVPVLARAGVLFVHPDSLGWRYGYVVSHEPTGLLVARFRKKTQALKALDTLAALAIDWPNIVDGENAFTAAERQMLTDAESAGMTECAWRYVSIVEAAAQG